jgi:hypothetical protein
MAERGATGSSLLRRRNTVEGSYGETVAGQTLAPVRPLNGQPVDPAKTESGTGREEPTPSPAAPAATAARTGEETSQEPVDTDPPGGSARDTSAGTAEETGPASPEDAAGNGPDTPGDGQAADQSTPRGGDQGNGETKPARSKGGPGSRDGGPRGEQKTGPGASSSHEWARKAVNGSTLAARQRRQPWPRTSVRVPNVLRDLLRERVVADRRLFGDPKLALNHYVDAALGEVPGTPADAVAWAYQWEDFVGASRSPETGGGSMPLSQKVADDMDELKNVLEVEVGPGHLGHTQAWAVVRLLAALDALDAGATGRRRSEQDAVKAVLDRLGKPSGGGQ